MLRLRPLNSNRPVQGDTPGGQGKGRRYVETFSQDWRCQRVVEGGLRRSCVGTLRPHLRRRGIVCCCRGGGKRAHERVIGTFEVHTLGIGPVGKRADADGIFSRPLKYRVRLCLLLCCCAHAINSCSALPGAWATGGRLSLRSIYMYRPGRALNMPMCTPHAIQNPHTPAPYLQDGILTLFDCAVLMSEDRGVMRP